MKKKSCICYCALLEKETRLRGIKFAQYLQLDGYEVKIFAGSALHNSYFNYIENKSHYIEKQYEKTHLYLIKNICRLDDCKDISALKEIAKEHLRLIASIRMILSMMKSVTIIMRPRLKTFTMDLERGSL